MRAAWTVGAHSWFDLSDYPPAEQAYMRLLDLTPGDDPQRVALVDNLAASIYKQGEQASLQQDHRAAADHFMRVKQAAPSSNIRASAEYDAAAALMHLEDWVTAAAVLEAFRNDHPDHELNGEATRQIAFAYRQSGQLDRAATEYERVASESEDTALQGEALLVAGELYEQSNDIPRALAAYGRYVEGFPRPIDTAVETRLKMARMYQAERDEIRYQEQLREIVRVDAEAGAERTNRTRTVAARSALVLAEQLFAQFEELELRQPFEASLREKKRRMDEAVHALEGLVRYEVGDVTAAATYYMAEIYWGLSQALMDSERPPGMQGGELQEYELALEEEAFPFEERAIDVHEKNMELMRTGLYNAWIDRSLAKLANLVPARYAKGEISSGFMGSIDRYAYSAPLTGRPVSTQGGDEQTLEPAEPDGSQAPPPPTDEGPVQTSKHRDRLIPEEVSVAHTN
jgi:outer membrane protein assembly factor BamD (BamD/ComL family)